MIVNKTWEIFDKLSGDDIVWLQRSGLEIELGRVERIEVFTPKYATISGLRSPTRVVTTDDRQEMWLKLYFGQRVYLHSVHHVLY